VTNDPKTVERAARLYLADIALDRAVDLELPTVARVAFARIGRALAQGRIQPPHPSDLSGAEYKRASELLEIIERFRAPKANAPT
jgi:hypothetical protein